MINVARWIKDYTERESEVSQKIDLKKYLGESFNDRAIELRIGQDLIDRIRERTESNKNILNKSFSPSRYSKDYADSLDFKAAGKSRSDVNMRLSGNMLESMTVSEEGDGVIKLGFDDSDANKIAYAHQTGFKGHPTIPQGKYQRPFFGASEKEIKEIASKYKEQIERRTERARERILNVIDEVGERSALEDFFSSIIQSQGE